MNQDSLEYRLLKKQVYLNLISLLSQAQSLLTQSNADFTDAEGNYSINTMETPASTTASIYRAAADNERQLWSRVKTSVENMIADIEGTKP